MTRWCCQCGEKPVTLRGRAKTTSITGASLCPRITCALVSTPGKPIAFHHRKACDEVTAFQDPVRFERSKGRDGIAFNGLDAPYYEIPNCLGEAVPRDRLAHFEPARHRAPHQHLRHRVVYARTREDARDRPGDVPPRLVKTNPRATHIIDTVTRMADWGRKRDGSGLGFTYMNYSGTQIALVAEVMLDRKPARCGCEGVDRADPGTVQPGQYRRADEQHHLRTGLCPHRAHHHRGRCRAGSISTTITCRA